MKTPNMKTLAITAAVTAIALGWLIKSGREEIKANPSAEPLAKKLGFIA